MCGNSLNLIEYINSLRILSLSLSYYSLMSFTIKARDYIDNVYICHHNGDLKMKLNRVIDNSDGRALIDAAAMIKPVFSRRKFCVSAFGEWLILSMGRRTFSVCFTGLIGLVEVTVSGGN
ncbi:MAG: hypothetical protein ACJAUP_002582 [Cellvibrionaceae bacterium]|jgi:hypothetical protein